MNKNNDCVFQDFIAVSTFLRRSDCFKEASFKADSTLKLSPRPNRLPYLQRGPPRRLLQWYSVAAAVCLCRQRQRWFPGPNH